MTGENILAEAANRRRSTRTVRALERVVYEIFMIVYQSDSECLLTRPLSVYLASSAQPQLLLERIISWRKRMAF